MPIEKSPTFAFVQMQLVVPLQLAIELIIEVYGL